MSVATHSLVRRAHPVTPPTQGQRPRLSHLAKAGVDVNVLCTIHAENEHRGAEVYRFFRDDLGAQFIQFIPIIERSTETLLPLANLGWSKEKSDKRPLYTKTGTFVTERSVSPDGYGRFLIDVFDEWVKRDVGEVYVQMFDTALANWHGEPGGLCIHQETCGLALAMEHNGDVYSCDHFVEPDHLLGNINETPMIDLVASDKQQRFGNAKRDSLPQFCRECDVRFACHGGCPRNRFTETPDGEPGLTYLCPSYKAFFHHVDPSMKLMSRLLHQNRAPSEITKLGVPKRN